MGSSFEDSLWETVLDYAALVAAVGLAVRAGDNIIAYSIGVLFTLAYFFYKLQKIPALHSEISQRIDQLIITFQPLIIPIIVFFVIMIALRGFWK